MWSIDGELLCVSNMEHPLPYRWRIQVDIDLKRKTKLINSLRVIKEIVKRFPNFKEYEHKQITSGVKDKRDPKVVTFSKLLNDIETKDRETSKY